MWTSKVQRAQRKRAASKNEVRSGRPYRINSAVGAMLAGMPLLGLLPPAALAQTGEALQQAQAARRYDIPAGPLSQVLPRFAAEAGVQISADGALTGKQSSPGVQGAHSVASGLATALRGTDLVAVRQAN
ncbi:MAG TPA: STN domain-containing protein, partial [Burkholderiaceae bacterium]